MDKFRIDPFEFLYIAIAIATFEHTTWTAAFMFEGPIPEGATIAQHILWYFKGGLIAIAIDVGMLMTSRYLIKSNDRWGRTALIVAFVIAAVSSFYTQVGYMVYHTADYTISTGVNDNWKAILEPIIDARVIFLPAILPLLATIYTLARLTQKRYQNSLEHVPEVTIVETDSTMLLPEPEDQTEIVEVEDGIIDFTSLKFYDRAIDAWRGPYKTKKTMLASIKALRTKRGKENDYELQ